MQYELVGLYMVERGDRFEILKDENGKYEAALVEAHGEVHGHDDYSGTFDTFEEAFDFIDQTGILFEPTFKIDYGISETLIDKIYDIAPTDYDSVKKLAEEKMVYTGLDVKIINYENKVILISKFYGVNSNTEDFADPLVDFDEFGYYDQWLSTEDMFGQEVL